MGHAETYAKGEGVNYNQKSAIEGTNQKDVDAGNKSEANAIRKENIMRKINGEELREYDYYPIYKK